MYSYNVIILSSIAELRENSVAWDDLWKRSSIATPFARAELIAQWVEQFSPVSKFYALVVEHRGVFYAALPIVESKIFKLISVGNNPSNAWCISGHLLLDFHHDPKSTVSRLVSGLHKLPFSLLWLDYVRRDDPEWVLFRHCLSVLHVPSHWHARYTTGVVDVKSDIKESSDLYNVKKISKIKRKFNKYYSNNYSFSFIRSCRDILNYLDACYEIEDKTWKGKNNGGSILSRNMSSYINNLALTLCESEEIYIFILKSNDVITSFLIAVVSKQKLYMLKTGYNPEFSVYGPGQVLMYLIINEFCVSNSIKEVDFVGELLDYQLAWNPRECINSQVVLPLDSIKGKFFYFLYNKLMPQIRRLKSVISVLR